MRKYLVLLMALALLVTGVEVFAGSNDYLSNQSAEYIRTLNRNGAVDSADIATYNPAGLTELADGLYFNLSNQFIFKTYTQENGPASSESTEPSLADPNFYLVWSSGSWAAFFSFTTIAGGGKLIYDDGLVGPVTANYAMLNSMFFGYTVGGAYAINDMFSVALGARLVQAKISGAVHGAYGFTGYDGTVTVKSLGYAGVVGLNIKPIAGLNIGMRYETETYLKWDTSTSDPIVGDTLAGAAFGSADGKHFRHDLPAIAGIGASYKLTPGLEVGASYQYYFMKSATLEGSDGTDMNLYDDGWEAGAYVSYTIIPGLIGSVGYQYTQAGTNSKSLSDLAIMLDSHTVSIGARYDIMPNLAVDVAFAYNFFQSAENSAGETFKQKAETIAIGVQYRM